MAYDQIQHVFVLMLENRSFDHLLGYSGLAGTDAATGLPASIDGLTGTEQNMVDGVAYPVTEPADYTLSVDPSHEFPDVLCQLAGAGAVYPPGGSYPAIDNSGYAVSYADACIKARQPIAPGEILKCYSASQLPVLTALATEFAVCDNWHAALPGPTWPNRMFVHAASSAGLDHSPSAAEIALWESVSGFSFPNGDIFDRIAARNGMRWRAYAGDLFPMISALKGITLGDVRQYDHFASDLEGPFPYNYVFIEPSYNLLRDYKGSTSQHPLDDVRLGEGLIKSTYEAIRNSSLWQNSLLIVTWDEHGGFYDHAIPPSAVAPGDTQPSTGYNKYGFTFEQYGPRVPGIVVSPWIPRQTIDHRLYDHSSVPATLEALFGLAPMTARDAAANHLLPLLSLAEARQDAPRTLPDPFAGPEAPMLAPATPLAESYAAATPPSRPNDSINDGNLPVILQAAMRQDFELSPATSRAAIIAKVAALKTRADAATYLAEVAAKRRASTAHPLS